MRNLQVNGERLWASLMELAEIGATPKRVLAEPICDHRANQVK